MENYIIDIIEDVKKLMRKNELIDTPEQAMALLVGEITRRQSVPRRNMVDAEKFVRKAIADDIFEMRDEYASNLDNEIFMDAVVYNNWQLLDAALYNLVCVAKRDEIARRVKAGKLEHGELH